MAPRSEKKLAAALAVLALCFFASEIPAQIPPGHYDSAEGKSGGELKQALHTLVRGHTVIPYSQLDQPLAEIWRDARNTSNVTLVYSSTSIPASATSWNREHLWPRLRGNTDQSGPDDSDLFHVVPTDIQVNAERGNLPFDFSNPSDPAYRIPAHSFAPQCSRDSDSWQPAPSERGDIARALFYMDVRYNGSEPNTSDLELVSLPPAGAQMGNLNTLLLWHAEDPPDDAERARNDLIHSRYQGNRNPFIDRPEFATLIWGSGNPGDPSNNPLARLGTLSASAAESPSTAGRFLVSLNQFAGANGTVVFFQMQGTASPDEFSLSGGGVTYDPATGNGTIRIEPNFSQAALELIPNADVAPEPAEEATMVLTGGEGCDITPDASSRATILIRDAPGLPIRWNFEEALPFPALLPSNLGEGVLSLADWKGTTNSFGGSTGKSLALVGSNGNASWIELRLSMRGWRDLILTFKTRGTTSGFNLGEWSYSINGGNFTTLPGVNTASRGSTFASRTVDFRLLPQLNNAESVRLRYTLSGASGSDQNNRIDELNLTATAYDGVESPIEATVFALSTAAREQGAVPALLGIRLNRPAPADGLQVGFSLSGTATPPQDYTVGGNVSFDPSTRIGGAFFPEGSDTVFLGIVPVADDITEFSETVVLTLLDSPDESYLHELGTSAVATIADLPNDDFALATSLLGHSANSTGTNLGASRETGEPWHAGGTTNNGGRSVWWKWTASENGTAVFTTQNSSFDTVLAVYQGTRVDALSLRGWNDDGAQNLASKLTLSVTKDETYHIAVDGYGLSAGNITFSVSTGGLSGNISAVIYPAVSTLSERGLQYGAIWIGLDPAPAQPLTVSLRLTGQAVPGIDYETTSPRENDVVRVTFTVGTQWNMLHFYPLADSDPVEFDESLQVSLEPGTGYSAVPGFESVTLLLADDTPYSFAWASQFAEFHGPAATPLGDPDADGIPNLAEFLLGKNPLASDGAAALRLEARSMTDPLDGIEKTFPFLIHERRADASSLTVHIESNPSLFPAEWVQDAIPHSTGAPDEHGRQEIIHRGAEPIQSGARFFRMRIVAP